MTTLLTLDQTAKQLGISRRKVNQMISRRQLAIVDLGYRTKRVRPVDVEKCLEKLTLKTR